ncbi:RDD family protein [Actinoplanes lobatus]|uniref:Putative RDD family membrane protein YckC n=1 Tax=Actinoplanes lobatus TaxID=113568 RepID=A0A7W7HLT9_9ACTN|nr:RDD family protein [Actinoplanes lobatus]MBB4752908.1 putative RDD family membrane protein YckC [Actinoplanes lobatus]GIE39516.1 transporter [Actinoplanes lobatus]
MLTVRVLTTAEAVEIDVRPARLGSRAIALTFDIIVQAILVGILTTFWLIVTEFLPEDTLLPETGRWIVIAIVAVGYPTFAETISNGRSIGKATMGLRVIREDGGPIRARHAFTRALIGLSIEWPGLLIPYVTWAGSISTMIASRRGRRLGDLAAGTLVVHERRPVPWNIVPGMPAGLSGWASTADLSAVDDALAEAVRQFAARSHQFAEPHRAILGQSLFHEVKQKVSPDPPPGTAPWLFLVAVLAERRRRSAAQLAATRTVTQRVLPGFGQLPTNSRR